ncbi:MAG: GxxExxY protein [bacterium]
MAFLHKELAFDLRKYIIEIHNEIGVGFDEKICDQGLMRRFMKAGLPFVSSK